MQEAPKERISTRRRWPGMVGVRATALVSVLEAQFRRAVAGRDPEAIRFRFGHADRVCETSLRLARKTGCVNERSASEDVLVLASLFHNIGEKTAQSDGMRVAFPSERDGRGLASSVLFRTIAMSEFDFAAFSEAEIESAALLIRNHDLDEAVEGGLEERFLLKILKDADIVDSVSNPRMDAFGGDSNVFSASKALRARFKECSRKTRGTIPDGNSLIELFRECEDGTAGDSLLRMLASTCGLTLVDSLREMRRSGVLAKYGKMLDLDRGTREILDFIERGTGLSD